MGKQRDGQTVTDRETRSQRRGGETGPTSSTLLPLARSATEAACALWKERSTVHNRPVRLRFRPPQQEGCGAMDEAQEGEAELGL